MLLRIFASIILLLSLLFMPFWFSAVLCMLCMVYFSFFVEGVVLITMQEALYGSIETKFFNEVFVVSFVCLLTFLLIQFLKKKLDFHTA
jgi:hypothetical protein